MMLFFTNQNILPKTHLQCIPPPKKCLSAKFCMTFLFLFGFFCLVCFVLYFSLLFLQTKNMLPNHLQSILKILSFYEMVQDTFCVLLFSFVCMFLYCIFCVCFYKTKYILPKQKQNNNKKKFTLYLQNLQKKTLPFWEN